MTLVNSEVVNIAIGKFIKARASQTGDQPLSFPWELGMSSPDGNGKARLHWLGRLILWTLDKASAGLTRLQIKDEILNALRQRELEIPKDFFEQELAEQMIELEYIFDAIMSEGPRFRFSIPLAQQWFHYVISEHPDPIRHAHAGMMQDYEEWKRFPEKEKAND